MTIIEILTLHLKEGVDISDPPTTPEAQIWKTSIDRVRRQAGVEFLTYNHRVEDRRYIQMFVGWDTLSSHSRFKQDPDLPATISNLRPLFTTFPTAFHVQFSPSSEDAKALLLPQPLLLDTPTPTPIPAAAEAPITEIFLAYFAPAEEVSDEVMSTYSAQVAEYHSRTEPAARRCGKLGGGGRYAGGWAIEEEVEVEVPAELGTADLEEGSNSKSKARVYVGLSGWESMNACGKFRESKEFQENIHLLQMAKAIEVFHIAHEQRPST